MANVTGLLAFQVKDHLGATKSFPLPIEAIDTTTLANLVAEGKQAQDLVDAVIDGQITGCTVKLDIPLDTANIKAVPAATAEIERTALANFSQANYKYKWAADIPTIADALIVNGKVNLADANWISFIALFTAGLTHIKFVSKFLQALIALLDVVITFRKSRRQEAKLSFEEGG